MITRQQTSVLNNLLQDHIQKMIAELDALVGDEQHDISIEPMCSIVSTRETLEDLFDGYQIWDKILQDEEPMEI